MFVCARCLRETGEHREAAAIDHGDTICHEHLLSMWAEEARRNDAERRHA